MKLPLPFTWAGTTWSEAELGKIKGGTVANAARAAKDGDYFGGVFELLAGLVTSLGDGNGKTEGDRAQLRNVLREMPSVDAEFLSTQALCMRKGQNAIEGIYFCPFPGCDGKIVCDEDHENADQISDLEIVSGEPDERVVVDLQDPVTIKNAKTQEVLFQVVSLTLVQPTVRHYMAAFQRVGMADELRYQYEAYKPAIEKVNAESVDQQWRNQWGTYLLENMTDDDLSAIGLKIRSRGLQLRVQKTCPKCGKSWMAEVSAMGFFASEVLAKK